MKFTLEEKKQVALCACKHTNNAPFCDGAHSQL
jgi:CDGSH iron-sulfur domain-containing protein 3